MATQTDKAVIDLVINGKQGETSLKSIATATVNARKELNKMAETDPGYAKQKAQLEALMAAQQQRIVRINQEKTAWDKFKAGAGSITAGVTGANIISAGIGLVSDAIRQAKEDFKQFDAASKELSAVTGATGADLEYLNNQAKQTGPQFGKTGAEMLEAYKLMASAKPELLAQKELLVETTQAAITLSRAGKIDLATATKVTAESLNQFGESADQANRFINVIAAGAKEGSAEINEMGAALKNAGTVAASQGVSFEETNAILQSLSTIALKGGEAGTGLRNVLLTLGSGSDDTNPKVVGLEKALDNLAKQNLSTAEMTKLFGKENVISAQHIIGHREEIALLTDKVTGTSEAFSQAAKNNDTYEQKLAVYDATMSKVGVTIGSKVIPMITGLMEGAMKVANWFDQQLTPASVKATQAFEDQRAKVQGLEKSLNPLLTRHDELKKKTVLTKDEQIELKNIVGQVASIVPQAVTEFDKYGNALGVNTEKAREFVKIQKELLKYNNKTAIEETDKELEGKLARQSALLKQLNSKKVTERTTVDRAVVDVKRDMTGKEITAMSDELKAVDEEIKALNRRKDGLTGDYLDKQSTSTPTKPAAPTGGGTGGSGSGDDEESKEEKKARLKREKAQREKEAAITANEQAKLAIEEMDVKAIKDEEQRDLAQAKLKADREREQARKSKANAQLKATWIKGIDDALLVEQFLIEEKYTKKKFEEGKKRLANTTKDAEDELEALRKSDLAKVEERLAAGAITEEEAKLAELEVEAQFLAAKELLWEAHYEAMKTLAGTNEERLTEIKEDAKVKSEEIDAEQTQNVSEQATARKDIREEEAKQEEDLAKKKKDFAKEEKEWRQQVIGELATMLINDWTGTLKGYKEFWKQSTLVQKAALIASKAYALAEIGINLARQITAVNTAASVIDGVTFGVGGTAYRIKGIAMAVGSAALQTAKVLSVGAQIPQFEDGGFTSTDKQPSGFTTGPTYFRQGNFIAGEKGQEWIMSGPMLQNPVMANLAGALQAMQVSGEYRNLSFGNSATGGNTGGSNNATSGGSSMEALMMVAEIRALRDDVKAQASRPINNNYFKVRETRERVDYINEVTKL